MTGAGFGGCAIALIKRNSINDFSSLLSDYYKDQMGYALEIFSSGPEDGVREIKF
ncbi:MAG: hypothetical protein ACRDEB_00170 [Chitinophagaceae bacterium]